MELTLPPPSVRKVCPLVTPRGRDVIKRRKSREIRAGEWPTGELSALSEVVNSGPEHVWHAGEGGSLPLPTSGGPQCLLCKFNIGLSALWDDYIWKKHCTVHTNTHSAAGIAPVAQRPPTRR